METGLDLAYGAGAAPLWGLVTVRVLGAYLLLGVVFAVAFHLRGLRRLDPEASPTTWGFRVLVTPGVVALWPLLARAWVRGGARAERNAHRDAAVPR